MRIAIINDTHCGARNAADVFLNYFAKFYSEVFFPYCETNGIKQIIHLGDYYDHRKYINFKALNDNRKTFLEPMRELGMTMDIIPGNHDVVYKNTNELCSLKELLGYFVENVNIVMEPKVLEYSGCNIALLPWINAENYLDSMDFIQSCKAPILGAHLELNGFDMMKGVPSHGGMDPKLFARFEQVWSGHYHTKSQKANIHYLGTQFETSWADVNDPKYFHVFDTDTRELTAVHNPNTLFSRIIYDDQAGKLDADSFRNSVHNKFVKVLVTSKNDLFGFDRFIDTLQKMDPIELKVAENYDEFLGDNVNGEDLEAISDTATLMDAYIDSSETELDKDVLKKKLRELYTEAQNLEAV